MNQFKYENPKTPEYSLLDEAVKQIFSENYLEALSYLQSCESFLETCIIPNSSFIKLTVLHNSSVCLCRLGRITECISCLESALHFAKQLLKKTECAVDRLRILKYLSVLQLQLCALVSQAKMHEKAMEYAQNSLKYLKEAFLSLALLVSQMSIAKQKQKTKGKTLDVISRLSIALDKVNSKNFTKKMNINIYAGEDWVQYYNIGSIMIIQPVLLSDWMNPAQLKPEVSCARVLEKICILAANYFCIAAEYRFIGSGRSSTPDFLTSKDWHDTALAIAKCFLPKKCPLLMHILASHKKHYITTGKEENKENNNITPIRRIYTKRKSEKSRACSVKNKNKDKDKEKNKLEKTPNKSSTPLRKITPSRLKKSAKDLGNTAKISTRQLLAANCPQKHLAKDKSQSEAVIKNKALLQTQKIPKLSVLSSDSEKRNFYLEITDKLVITSNDLYGDYSVLYDCDQNSTVIKSQRSEAEIEKKAIISLLRPDCKTRLMSSTGGKN